MTGKNAVVEETVGQMFGRLGGQATLKKYGNKHFKKLSEKAAEARKAKKTAQN